MTIKEYMEKVTAASATGEYVGRDMVLGLDCSETPSASAAPGDIYLCGGPCGGLRGGAEPQDHR